MRVTAKYLCAVAFGIGLAVTSSGPARADMYPGAIYDPLPGAIYHVVSCADDPAACAAFDATNAPPPANYLDGFSAAAFADYILNVREYTLTPGTILYITDVNANGFVIGSATNEGGGYENTEFVFHNGEFSCCFTDNYKLNGINGNNFVVGHDELGYGFMVPVDASEYGRFGTWMPEFDPASITLLESLGFPYLWDFIGIDNNNTILVNNENVPGPDGYGARYLLVPTTLVPEPGSGSLVATGLVALLLFRKRRSRG